MIAPEDEGTSGTSRRRKRGSRGGKRSKPAPKPVSRSNQASQGGRSRSTSQANEFWWLAGNASVSQGYGVQNSMYEHGYHDGLDIAVPVGTAVSALTSGTVVFAGDAGADGMRVGIRMPNGKVYYYGHLSKLNVEVGDKVTRGQVVAKSGDTGRTTGPHVHFELDRNRDGTGDSPLAFLQRWSGGKAISNGAGGSSGPDTAVYPTGTKGSGLAKNNTTADYGWSEAVFNSNPELKKLLAQAKANDWDGQTMQAAIRGTDWYRNHAEVWRKNWVLKRDNPEQFQRDLQQARGTVDAIANEFGVNLTEAQRNKVAHDMLWLGLNQTEINDAIGKYFNTQGGDFTGTAGDLQDKVMSMAADYGVRVSDDWVGRFVKGMLTGTMTEQDADNYLKDMAKSAYPSLAAQIDSGMTVKQIADPYVQAMSQILELPDSSIDAYDPTVRSALHNVGKDGAPTTMPLWQFEETLRKDPRWLSTNNARDSLLNSGNQLLKTWGVVA